MSLIFRFPRLFKNSIILLTGQIESSFSRLAYECIFFFFFYGLNFPKREIHFVLVSDSWDKLSSGTRYNTQGKEGMESINQINYGIHIRQFSVVFT